KYQHTDALGSPVAVTNEAGTVIDRTNYEPYGAAINKPAYEGIGYTGHVMDGATGLAYMQQRYYDPGIGAMLSVDPVTANSATGGNFNRYWYANNNPYKFTDPDGRQASICEKTPQRCKAVIQVGPPSMRSGDNQPGTRLTDKPLEGGINKKNTSNRTADGGFDPDGAKKLRSGGARPHKGVDIDSASGNEVKAAGFGKLENKSDPNGYGTYVEIKHGDGLTTRYAHLSSTKLPNGTLVSGGDVIGETGTSGNLPATADPHLHFEIRVNGVPKDPTMYFNYEYEE
ncbi:peptidoglycan DD-metalloendopeptidase family protein, partial [Pseudoxanthomonas sacheonensis]|uniref:peptidoglycan DD-metalloendopeptidase family protein n=1 Tax=Pseudoxanthomonas sacheonensis TaxID=443615 RepID=UPI0013D1C306